MTTTINASTSSGLVVTPDNSGNVVLQYNGVSTPTFSVYISGSNQSFTTSTWTTVAYNAEDWDTASCYDTSTYRFTPTVAGYYQINVNVGLTFSGTSSVTGVGVLKNGSLYVINVPYATYNTGSILSVSGIVYLNGTTDYITGGVYSTGTSPAVVTTGHETHMTGCLLRGA